MSGDLTGAGSGPARKFGDKVLNPPNGRHWMYDQFGIDKAIREDRIFWTKNDVPRLKKFTDEATGMRLTDVWTDVQPVRSWHKDEATGYPTQKSVALLQRIIAASSNPGDLVLDCFSGSGTTAVAAEQLGPRWLGCDSTPEYCGWAAERIELVEDWPVEKWIRYDQENAARRKSIRTAF